MNLGNIFGSLLTFGVVVIGIAMLVSIGARALRNISSSIKDDDKRGKSL